MTRATQGLDHVREYYCTDRSGGAGSRTILDIWESGEAFQDSITPSTYVPEYRSHVGLKLLSLTGAEGTIFSIGCGNAFVESDLVRAGRRVRAVDLLPEAVELARGKGVEAEVMDFHDLTADDLSGVDTIYADGLVGHLIDGPDGAGPAVRKLAGLGLRPGALLVISNDSPRDPAADVAPHEKVPGFWFVSRTHLAEVLTGAGLTVLENYYFPYVRPISGLRNRTMCVARFP